MFPWGECPTFRASRRIAFYRRAVHPEGSGRLAVWYPSVYGLEGLLAQVIRMGFMH